MDATSPKKLKRGLKDVSPLFAENPVGWIPSKRLGPETEILALSLFHPDFPADSHSLSRCLCKKVEQDGYPSALVLLRTVEALKKPPQRMHGEDRPEGADAASHGVSWEQLEALTGPGSVEPGDPVLLPQVLVVDFDYRYKTYVKRVIPLLDKWVLHLRAQAESLNEGYRMLKLVSTLNPHLDYHVLFDGEPQDPRGPALFERFSEMASRRLGLSMTWLGHFPLEAPACTGGMDWATESLLVPSFDAVSAPGKIALARHLQVMSDSNAEVAR
ncbi:MAG: hypothetical protein WC352_06825 [Candidatus Omnitrophota bacterium]|jgi:hypothetical protein